MRAPKIVSLSILLLASACATDGTGAGAPSWFRATISGEVTDQFEGSGDFSFDPDDGGTPRYFRITAAGEDTEVEKRFWVRWPDDRRPQPGTYALVPHADAYGSPQGITAVYRWHRGNNVSAPSTSELYVATAGEVTITRSTGDEVEGSIRFAGTLVEKVGPTAYVRDDPRNRPDPAAPRIEVTGSFRLTRFDEAGTTARNW